MNRKDGEKYKSFLTRVVDANASGQITYGEMGDLLVDDNRWCDDNWRKFSYIIKPVIEKLNQDIEYTQSDVERELEDLKNDIYKEKVKLRDQRRGLNKLRTSEARFENLRDLMIERLDDIGTLPKEYKYEECYTDVLGATLILSDIHYGIKVDNQFNYFDVDVCEERVNTIIDKTIKQCELNGVNKLNVELCGDLVSGIIQTSGRVEQEEDIIEQIIGVSDLLSNAINKLSEHIEKVVVYVVGGNHSRVIADKKQSMEKENFERLIAEFIKRRVSGITLIDGKGQDFLKYKDYGRTFVITHGHNGKSSNAADDYEKLFMERVDCIHMGHWHTYSESFDQNVEVVVNGSIVGSDDYALSIRKNSKPMQVLKMYTEEDSITYRLFC